MTFCIKYLNKIDLLMKSSLQILTSSLLKRFYSLLTYLFFIQFLYVIRIIIISIKNKTQVFKVLNFFYLLIIPHLFYSFIPIFFITIIIALCIIFLAPSSWIQSYSPLVLLFLWFFLFSLNIITPLLRCLS